MLKNIFRHTFDFFASPKLAVFLLIVLAVALAAGTIIESLHGAHAAQQVVYHSEWFNFFLGILAINVAAAAIDRIPWQQRHIGFLLTHTGILMILLGSWMTYRFAVDGQISLAEGEKGSRITVSQSLLQIIIPGTDQGVTAPFKTAPFQWKGKRPIPLPDMPELRAYLTAYYPNAEPVERVLPKRGGSPAIHIELFNEMTARTSGPPGHRKSSSPAHERGDINAWLLLGVQDHDLVNMGPAVIRFSAQPMGQKKSQDFKGTLILNTGGRELPMPVSEALEKPWPIPDTAYTLEVKRFLSHAVVEKNKLTDYPEAPLNPACELVIKGGDVEERHVVFARFPDFPTIHGLKPSQSGIKIRFDYPEETDTASEIRILRGKDGKLFYQIKTQDAVGEQAPIEAGKEYDTGWMALKFRVADYLEEAECETGFDPRPMPQGKEPLPAARIEFEKSGESRSIWLTRGGNQVFFLGGRPFHVTYGLKTLPVEFELELKDFIIDYYPGSNRPAGFKSSVTLRDPFRSVTQNAIISMNEPLDYRGFKIYQSGYDLGNGGPDISIFSVGRDPGIPVKYAGSIVMILGTIVMFYLKRFTNTRPFYETNGTNQ